MPRIRYVKPDFFKDEDIIRLKHSTRLLYIGLWCLADKAGRLEDRPKRIKIELFPDQRFDVEKELKILSEPKRTTQKPFILRYVVDNVRFIQILEFEKHQRPHHTEKDSVFPQPSKEALTVTSPLCNGYEPQEKGMEKEKGMESEIRVVFDYYLLKTKKKFHLDDTRRKIILGRLKEGRTVEDMKLAIDNFCADDWVDRPKHMDLQYCLGTKNKINNLDKWLNRVPQKKKRELL